MSESSYKELVKKREQKFKLYLQNQRSFSSINFYKDKPNSYI